MKVCGIYEIKCKSDKKNLIGSSNHIMRRYSQHLWDLRRGIHHNPHLQSAFFLYGEINFEINILEECNENDLLIREDWWIANKNTLDPKYGFNLKLAFRPTHSKETCKRISDGKKGNKNPMYGKHLSDDHKKKIRDALRGKNSYMFGKTPSYETRQKMSKSQMGKKLSKETKIKIGLASKGRVVSNETRKKLSDAQSGEKHWNYGKTMSEETKTRISVANKGKHAMPDKARVNMSKRMKENNPMHKKENILKRMRTIELKKIKG